MFVSFIEQLKKRLQQPLPGEEAQFLMAPVDRQKVTPLLEKKLKPVKSAVLILLFPKGKNIHTILIKRAVYKGIHSAQIAFPGGKFERSDGNLQQTAIRETYEEIGINPQYINVMGKLTDIYITPSNYLVSPYLAYINETPNLNINTQEVEKIIITNLLQLNNPSIRSEKLVAHSNGIKVKTPYYKIEGTTVWGATAMMISELNIITNESGKIIS